jgi:hypothetical protein
MAGLGLDIYNASSVPVEVMHTTYSNIVGPHDIGPGKGNPGGGDHDQGKNNGQGKGNGKGNPGGGDHGQGQNNGQGKGKGNGKGH